LCRWLRPDLDRFPGRRAYLQPPAEHARQLRERYRARFPGRRIVGISWRGGSRGPDVQRSTSLNAWEPILRTGEAGFVSLQYGETAAEIDGLRTALGLDVVHDPSVDPLADLDALAAQVAAMDLVITVDNSTAHMAGALDTPVWVLLPWAPNWRWRIKGERSHWYPAARLWRQTRAGDWTSIIEEVRGALAAGQRDR
jgi:hypothetical protein